MCLGARGMDVSVPALGTLRGLTTTAFGVTSASCCVYCAKEDLAGQTMDSCSWHSRHDSRNQQTCHTSELQGLLYCGEWPRGGNVAATHQRWSLPVFVYKGPWREAAASVCNRSVQKPLRQQAQSRHNFQGLKFHANVCAGP